MHPRAPYLLLIAALAPTAGAAEDAEIARGRELFATNCEACHGPTGEDGEAGDIRGVPLNVVIRATRGIEQMPAFALSQDELRAIVAYLEYLGRH